MKRFVSLFLILFISISLAACTSDDSSRGAYSGTLVLEGRHVYGQEVVLPGSLIVVDGEVGLEPGARVAGPVFLLGGVLKIGGEVEGDVSVIGGLLKIEPGAHLEGDLRVGGGDSQRATAAVIEGQVLTGAASGVEPEALFPERSLSNVLIWLLPESLALAGLAYLAARFVPGPVSRVSRAVTNYPGVSLAMGLLASVVGLVLLVVMAFTLILIPVTFLGLVIGFLAIGYGWIGMGLEVGHWLEERWKPDFNPSVFVFLGTFFFMLFLNLAALLPFVGDWIYMLAAVLALGAVLLTRFGLRDFIPNAQELS